MKKIVLGLAAIVFAGSALADTYSVGQSVHAPQFAINVADIRYAVRTEQIAQNVGNVATIKDLDNYGGDHFSTGQTVTAMQFAKNTLTARNVGRSIDQTAINFGNDLTIKDKGGVPAYASQTVNSGQSVHGLQHAINKVRLWDPATITQVAANTGNTMSIDLPSTPSINHVSTGQTVTAPQVAGNFANVPYVGSLSQTAANAGNAVTINQ